MKVSEGAFLMQVKDGYRQLFAREFGDLRKGGEEVLIYEREGFLAWEDTAGLFRSDACPLVDRVTNKVFIIKKGLHAYFQTLLYAHDNDLNMLSRKTSEEADNFIYDGQGYCLNRDGKLAIWLMGENFVADSHDKRILRNQRTKRISAP